MLNYIWAAMIFVGVLYGAINGTMKEITEAALQSAGEAVSFIVPLMAPYKTPTIIIAAQI